MKKICFITTIPLTIKAFVLKTADYIHENTDWDISVICDADIDFANSLPQYIHYYPIQMKRGISWSGINAIRKMKSIFDEEKFDLIQYSTPNASFYASLAGKFSGIPVRLYCQWGIAYVGFTGVKRWIFKKIEKVVCRNSTWIEPDSCSNLQFAHSEKLYPRTVGSVIWNGSACGVDLEKFNIDNKESYRAAIRKLLHIPEEAYVYGFVGRITRDKGINELLYSFKRISSENENTYLLMVGPTENDTTVDDTLYDWSKTFDRVRYTGYTSVVEQYLAAMDAYILPSYREGFGMGVVEAEAMGLPVIVTDIPGPIDAMRVNETGLIVPKSDEIALYEAMNKMYNGDDITKVFGQAAHNFAVENFDQKTFQKHLLADRIRLIGQ